jgi:putative Holliday junction resolvase
LELSGEEEEACVKLRHFANKLIKKTSLPIFLQDERLSTAAVTRALQESDMTRKKRQSVDDKLAASYILQLVLDRLAYQKS